jgi:two-component system chemotaxis response regulator CheB
MNGLECLDRIMVERPCPVVMVSSLTAEGADATLEALRLGAVDFVPKPEARCRCACAQFAPSAHRESARGRLRPAQGEPRA